MNDPTEAREVVKLDPNQRYDVSGSVLIEFRELKRKFAALASPETDMSVYEPAIPHLMNFRKWTRETDKITDHDLLITAREIMGAVLRAVTEDTP